MGHRAAQHIQQLFLCDILVRQIIFKTLIYLADILQLIMKIALRFQPFHKLIQLFKPDPILGELRDYRLHLTDIALLFQIPPQYLQLVFIVSRNFTQNKILPLIIQNPFGILPGLLKDPVRQPPEAQNINIHDSMPGMQCTQILLRLHRKLLGHQYQIIQVRVIHRIFNHLLI